MSCESQTLFSVAHKVVVVTGASRGIGAALASGFSSAGATVIGLARSETPSDELLSNVDYRQCDILDDDAFKRICESVYSKYNIFNILINCAGVSLSSGEDKLNKDIFRKTLDVNLLSAYNCCVTAKPFIRESGGGSIINITSINSLTGFPGNPGYVAAKGGLRLLTKALAIDFIEDNIRVNAIAPGYIQTDMTNASFTDTDMHNQRLKQMIIPRWGKPEDLVGAAIFLSSHASSYITGQDIVVDGGWTSKGLV